MSKSDNLNLHIITNLFII